MHIIDRESTALRRGSGGVWRTALTAWMSRRCGSIGVSMPGRHRRRWRHLPLRRPAPGGLAAARGPAGPRREGCAREPPPGPALAGRQLTPEEPHSCRNHVAGARTKITRVVSAMGPASGATTVTAPVIGGQKTPDRGCFCTPDDRSGGSESAVPGRTPCL